MSVYGTDLGHFIDTLFFPYECICPSKLEFSEPQSRLVMSHILPQIPTRTAGGARDLSIM